MSIFNQLALSVFKYYKPKLKNRANSVAVFYVSFLQSALLLLLGIFFSKFFSQMKVEMMSSSNAWTLFVIAVILIYFKNWMSFTGKKRLLLNVKSRKNTPGTYNVWVLWFLPFACIILSYVLLQKA